MTYRSTISALADPTRRNIVELLRAGPCNVAKLAENLPVSRPAVSQHLKILSDAGLLAVTRKGTRRIYRLDPTGADDLRTYLDRLWGGALSAFKIHIEKATPMIEPIIKEITVPVSQDEAFGVFTTQFGKWWPLKSHSLSASDGKIPKNVTFAARVGGAIVEELHDGTTANWGLITEWQPARKLVFTWHLRRPETEQTKVSVEFLPDGNGTRLRLVHSGWDAIGDAGISGREQYFSGWDVVLDAYLAKLTA